MSSSLKGKIGIVTGGGSGIGFATARSLAAEGARVVMFDRNTKVLAYAEKSLLRDGLLASSVIGDVSRGDDVEALVAGVYASFGRIDILVNNAAIQPYGTVETTSDSDWDRVLAVNLKGIYFTGHYAIPIMRTSGGGAIVNVASVQGTACQANVAAYTASKGAVLALTRAMALDHAQDGIRVNSVSPGSIDTPALRECAAQSNGALSIDWVVQKWGSTHPVGRVGTAEEVAALISFLCGPNAAFCTGADFRVDGGLLAKLAVVDEVDESP
jgi:NAD(P)-dependent dehydrogenase (short-subunit alcohol dehydrogenase family)